ncbi:RIMS-binding protein 2 [Collichthys lucidus]|uniref:RIMS-binding protein 2 n=1 Tax=Collichthys lucidus TaxID=240159 RepID=A0A4U5VA33_COLLU|nr:RIMS-binding protein 2 [Collichthys lucidus]
MKELYSDNAGSHIQRSCGGAAEAVSDGVTVDPETAGPDRCQKHTPSPPARQRQGGFMSCLKKTTKKIHIEEDDASTLRMGTDSEQVLLGNRVEQSLRYEVSTQQTTGHSVYNVSRFRLLEERNRALKLEVATLRQEKQQYRKLQHYRRLHHGRSCKDGISQTKRSGVDRAYLLMQIHCGLKLCEGTEKKSSKKAKLHAALQEKNRLNLELINRHLKASKYDQVQSDYDQLRETFAVVSQERDVAQQQRTQLQGKVEDLEQLLKHMHEAVELKQQLQIEHEQALVALHTKQKAINQLQKVKVRDLEQKCRSQTEHYHQLSKELLNFRLASDTVDNFTINPTSTSQTPALEEAPTSDESAANTPPLISQLLPCTPQTGDRERPELLSVKSSTVTTDRPSSPRQLTPSEMEDEASPSPRSKPRYTGQVRLCTARYSYNPYDGPNEHPEAELPLVAGKYLYVYGNMDDDGFYEGELLDGQRGLVPSNFVEFVQDKEKLAIQSGEGGEDLGPLDHTPLALTAVDGGASQDGLLGSTNALVPCSNGTGGPLDPEDLAEDVVPYPRKISLIKQLARSVIVAWEPPVVPLGWGNISGYNVLVDGELRASIAYGGRTKCLLEKLDLDGCVHRVSVQSVTDRGLSDELRCTVLVGANVVVAPCGLRVDDIQPTVTMVTPCSWMRQSTQQVKPGRYRLRFLNLKPLTVYKVTVVAQPHQVPWQLPLEQRERKETGVEFCTQAAGPPMPPHDVQVLCGQAPGVLQVHWKPPILSPTGTSNGANVVGYAVCTKGQRVSYQVTMRERIHKHIAEVLYPMADYVTVEMTRIQCLEAKEVIVRTLSVQGESQDSQVAVIPNNLLVPLPALPLPPPMHPHAGPPPHPHAQPHLTHATPQLPAPPQAHGQPLPPHPSHPQPHPRPPHPGGPQQPQLRPQHPQPQPLHLQPHLPHRGPRPQHQLPLLPHPQHHPIPQRPVCARDLDAKEHAAHHGGAIPPGQPGWDLTRSSSSQPVPMQGHTLEAPPCANPRSPSPQRILPQPRGTLIPDTVAKAIAREAAQRVAAESGKGDRRQGRYEEQGHSFHQHHSDEEEEDEEGFARGRRRGPSVDEFLRGSELGRPPHYSHNEDYHSESSRGSDLSDIMEEDEEELYSEMQLEEGRRRNSHNTPKANTQGGGRHDRESGRRAQHGGSQPQRRALMVPSIEVTSENNSEGNLSPITEDVYYGRVARHRTRPSRRQMGGTRSPHDGYRDRDRRSPTYYDEPEPEESFRIFVALFDYDPLSMSPNPDAADEELPFKEGQIIRVYGDKDTDGFYRGEVRGRMGLIPCNMVSEIRAEDKETLDQLIKQGFLPLSTPVDTIGHPLSLPEQNRRCLCRDQASRRMVALYDYDPRESSPNVDVEAELTFCAGDILAVFREIDEDGFYYGEINGHRGLVPSNFLEEVPDDVEVYLTDTPSHYPQEEPANRPPANSAATVSEGKRVTADSADTVDNDTVPVRAPSPIVRPLLPGTMRSLSPTSGPHIPMDPRDPRDSQDLANKKKKGLLSKGKKLLKRLSPVK